MKDSAIQWTDHSFNPWEGCTKVAPECKNCYAEVLVDHRFHRAMWGKGQPRRRTSENLWKQPLAWDQQVICDFCGTGIYRKAISFHPNGAAVCRTCNDVATFHRPRVFCLSLGDWLDEEVPIEWLADLLALIHATPNLDWQLLTKRPQNWNERIRAVVRNCREFCDGRCLWLSDWVSAAGVAPDNIWIGVSAGADQKAALEIPAKVHFLSCEPMLHALDTTHAAGFDWIIFGGESGKNARRLDVDWIEDGIQFCREQNVAPFVKQLGARPHIADVTDSHGWDGNNVDWEQTGRIFLKDSHGGDMNEWPENLRVREFPNNNRMLATQ